MFLPVNRNCQLTYQRCARLTNNCDCDYVRMVEPLSKVHEIYIYRERDLCIDVYAFVYLCTYTIYTYNICNICIYWCLNI